MNLPSRDAKAVDEGVGVPNVDAALQAIGVFRVPARRDSNIGHAEQSLDGGPFTNVVAFGTVSDPLKEIAEYQGGYPPIPRQSPEAQPVRRPCGEEDYDAGDDQWDANHVDVEVERQLMAEFPPLQATAQ